MITRGGGATARESDDMLLLLLCRQYCAENTAECRSHYAGDGDKHLDSRTTPRVETAYPVWLKSRTDTYCGKNDSQRNEKADYDSYEDENEPSHGHTSFPTRTVLALAGYRFVAKVGGSSDAGYSG